MSQTEKYLIVSLGSIGRRHLTNLRTIKPNAKIAVWRQHNTKISDLPEGADYQFSSLKEVLEFKPEAAIIASPSSKHLDTAIALANAGIHLLIEKPIANELEGLDQLLSTCNQSQLTLMVGYNLRFLPSLLEVKRMIDTGEIGKVLSVRAEVGQYLPDWRPTSDYKIGVTAQASMGGGVLLELSHELDYIYWIFGMPDTVTACGGHLSDLELDVEDTVELLLEYKAQKCLINVHLDMVQRSPTRCCRVVGDKGTLVWDAIADQIKCYTIDAKRWQIIDQFALDDKNQMYLDELNHFFDSIQQMTNPTISGESGKEVLAIVEAARLSIATSQKIEMSKS